MKIFDNLLNSITEKKAVIKFSLLIFLTEFVRGAYLNFIPLYSDNILKYSVAVVGAIISAYFLAETLSKIGVGWVLDRFNNRVVLVTGLLMSLVSLYLLKFIHSPILLILDGALNGLGFAPVWLIVLGYITTFPEEKRALSMGIVYSAWLVGLGLGGVLVNFLITKSYSFALNILIILWVVCVLIGLLIKEGIKSKERKKDIKSPVSILKEFANVKYLIPGMLLQTLSITILAPIIPIYLTNPDFIGISKNQYGIALAVLGIVTVISMIVFGAYAKRVGVERLFVFGLLFTSIGIIGMGNLVSTIAVFTFGLVIGISYSAVLPSWNVIMSNNIEKENKGVMWGGFSTIEGLGRALGSLAGGIISNRFNFHFSFNVSGIIIFILSIYYLIVNNRGILKHNDIN